MSLMSHPAAGWSIRRAKQPDRGAVEDVFVRSLREMAWRRSQTDELIRFRQTILAAEVFVAEEAAAGIIGFVSLEGLTAYVPHLFVDEDWRLCGVGRGLLDVARDQVARMPGPSMPIQRWGGQFRPPQGGGRVTRSD